jgi:DNA-binding CsgD family transcriptional regulator
MDERMLGDLKYSATHQIIISLEDAYLAEGMMCLVHNVVNAYEISMPIVIFEPSRYLSAMTFIKTQRNYSGIMLIGNNNYRFFDFNENIYRVKKSLKVIEMKESLIKIICGELVEESPLTESLLLNTKEIEFINLIRLDLSPAQISQQLNVNIKTVYAVRQRLVVKLSCVNFQDFYLLCKSKFFSDWLNEKRHLKNFTAQYDFRP